MNQNNNNKILVNFITTPKDFKALMVESIREAMPLKDIQAQLKSQRKEKLYTVNEVAKLFKVTTVTVYDWKNQGILAYIKINSRIRFKEADVLALYQSKRRRR